MKVCGNCLEKYPKTKEYFFVRKIKNTLANGNVVYYDSFRSDCKKCHTLKGNKRRVKNRCKDLNCKIKDYTNSWKTQYSKTRTKDLEAKKNLSEGQYNNFRKKLRIGFEGDFKDYLKDSFKNKHSKPWLRKFDYKGKVFLTKKERQNKSNNYKIKNITDSYIANYYRFSVKDFPKEIIETKRLIIQLKRQTR